MYPKVISVELLNCSLLDEGHEYGEAILPLFSVLLSLNFDAFFYETVNSKVIKLGSYAVDGYLHLLTFS
jgi:hypothetical protein